MADETQGRTEAATTTPSVFRVPLSGDGHAEVVSEHQSLDDDAPESDTPEASASTEQSASDDGEEKPELPSAEELGVDPNSAVYKELHKKFTAAYSRWINKKQKAMAQATPSEQPKAQASEPEQKAQPEQTASDDPFSELYAVDFSGFKPTATFKEGSDLASYGDEIRDFVSQAVQEAIKHTLSAVQGNDSRFRQKVQESQRIEAARGVIEKYAAAIQDHPDYPEKAQELADLAESTRALALKDPEKWVKMASTVTGLSADWNKEDEPAPQQGVRLATKPRAVVQRPSAGARLNGVQGGSMGFDQAWEATLRQHGVK